MNSNGVHARGRSALAQAQAQRDRSDNGIDLPLTNGSSTGPMQSHIQVAKPFVFQQTIENCFNDLGVAQVREDNIRLAGVKWIDDVRKALKLPIRTFDTAVVYYHKFRLSHADNEYSFTDAAAAALFAACKIDDTLKKSKDILCAAHNIKVGSRADHITPDDPALEQQSKATIGLERLMLEASSFDFRTRHPQAALVKIAKYYQLERHSSIVRTAHLISLDLYRTFAPLKQGSVVLAYACLELAGRLHEQKVDFLIDKQAYRRWGIERSMVMETLLDLLDLYTHYRSYSTVGTEFSLDTFIQIRIPLNEEQEASRMPRYTEYIDTSSSNPASEKMNGISSISIAGRNGTGSSTRPSPTSPATPGAAGIRQKAGERGKEGTVRFMLNPDRERQERDIIKSYGFGSRK